jgi:O-antigen ligase
MISAVSPRLGPLMGRVGMPNVLVAAGLCIAALLAAAASSSPALAFGLIGVAMLVVAPEVALLAAVGLAEEELVAGGHASESVPPLVRFGSNLYQANMFGFRVIALAAILGAAVSFIRRRPKLSNHLALLLVCATAWTCCLGLSQGVSLKHAVTAATPWLLLLCGYVVGASVRADRSLQKALTRTLAVILALKSAIALSVFLRGTSQAVGGLSVVYYDSFTPYLGGAALLAAITSRDKRGLRAFFAITGAILLGTSIRRNVIFALVGALLLLGARRSSRRIVIKAAAGCALTVLVLSFVAPAVTNAASRSIAGAFDTTAGGNQDSSTQGHLNDLSIGREVVAQGPWFGVGVYAQAQPGLVVSDGGNLYIHDEYLQTWARYGLPGIVVLLGCLTCFVRRAWRSLANPPDSVLGGISALLLLALPISLVFFPQVSALTRFDLLVGVLAGTLAPIAGARKQSRELEDARMADAPRHLLVARPPSLAALP